MDKFVAILWIFCAISVSFGISKYWFFNDLSKFFSFAQLGRCQDGTLDCDQPPPTNVDPGTCCRISKPFDRLNFPDCFTDVDQTSTARNEITNRDDRDVRDTDDDNIQTRFNTNGRNSNSDGNRRSERVPTTDNRDADSGDSESRRDNRRDNRPNGKPHWGFSDWHHRGGGWHHGSHGDYHSFGAGGRYRHKRQLDRVVVRTSVRAQVTLQSGVGNGNVIAKWKFQSFSKYSILFLMVFVSQCGCSASCNAFSIRRESS